MVPSGICTHSSVSNNKVHPQVHTLPLCFTPWYLHAFPLCVHSAAYSTAMHTPRQCTIAYIPPAHWRGAAGETPFSDEPPCLTYAAVGFSIELGQRVAPLPCRLTLAIASSRHPIHTGDSEYRPRRALTIASARPTATHRCHPRRNPIQPADGHPSAATLAHISVK